MSARPATDGNKETDIPEKLYDANSGTTYDRKRFFGKVRSDFCLDYGKIKPGWDGNCA